MSTHLNLFDLNRYWRVHIFELRENREIKGKWRRSSVRHLTYLATSWKKKNLGPCMRYFASHQSKRYQRKQLFIWNQQSSVSSLRFPGSSRSWSAVQPSHQEALLNGWHQTRRDREFEEFWIVGGFELEKQNNKKTKSEHQNPDYCINYSNPDFVHASSYPEIKNLHES